MNNSTKQSAYCIDCQNMCKPTRCTLHTGGPPCADDSKLGSRRKDKGMFRWVTHTFIRQRQDIREPFWIE